MADETSEKRNNARVAILELANMISVPMSLNAIVRLNVADAIWQAGSNNPLSAAEILTRVQQPNADPENLQRILRMLTTYGVFTEHIINDERKYSLTEVGQTLVTDPNGLSYGAYVLQHHQDALMRSWPLVHEAVLDPSVEPFVKANGGQSAYGYYGENHEMNELMQKAMSGVSVPFMKAILDGYDGFQGVSKLVDVGGSAGDCLKMIMQKYPHVKHGINFDLPEVVAKAPLITGVTHVGGDMFKAIPSAEAIFMKWVLTTWTDDECKVIMENCYKALPKGGKCIACEPVLPHDSDASHRTRALLEGDIFVMTIYRAKGKHRTEEEFRHLGQSTGTIPTMGKYKCYVVIKGRNAGIYRTWEDCKAQVDGFPNALFWGCQSEEEAVEALSRNNGAKTSKSTQAILEKFKRPEVEQSSQPPCTYPAIPAKEDDWKIVQNLVGLLLVALITLVVVLIAVVVKLFLI